MGMFGFVTNRIFKKKETVEPLDTGPELEAIPPLKTERETMPREPLPMAEPLTPTPLPEKEQVEMSNVKAKLDLILTEIDSIRIQNRNIDERLKAIEKTLAEMRGIKYY